MANRCYALGIEGCLGSSYRECVLHMQSTGTADGDTFAAAMSLVTAFDTSAKAQWLATLPGSYFLTRTWARRVDLKPSATGCHQYNAFTTPGTRGSSATANQTCPSIFLVPSMGTKSGGKIFWPCIPQGDIVSNALTTAWQTVVDTFIAALVSGITASSITWTLAVYSRKLNSIANVASHSFSPVIGFQGRRRKPVGGA